MFMYRPMTCGSRCYIVNEAHGLMRDMVRRLLKMTEYPFLSEYMTWIFTTTTEGQLHFDDNQQDAQALMSRCMVFNLDDARADGLMARRLKEIAQAENKDGQPIAAYAKLLSGYGSNMRAALQDIDRGAMVKK